MIVDVKMAWRNIWRNPRRTVLTIAAISFASLLLVFMLSFQFGCYETMINTSVKASTGHLQVQAKGYLEDKDIRFTIDDPARLVSVLEKVQGINAFTLRATGFSLVSSEDRTYGVIVTGIEPEKEAAVSTIESLVRKGSYLEKGDSFTALAGELLAQNLKVGVGDELTLLGQGRDGSIAAAVITIKGLFESGIDEFDRNAVMIGLNDFQEIFSMRGGVHEAVVTAASLKDVSRLKKIIQNGLNQNDYDPPLVVPDWMEIMPGLLQSIQMDLVSGIIMYLILVVVVAFSIFNTFLMAILERTREFGVMMAIGITPGRLTRLVLLESVCMTLVGIVVGIILGSLVTLYFQKYGIYIAGTEDMMKQYGLPERLFPKLSLISSTIGPVAVFIITSVSSIFPALRIRKLNPVEAMNHV